MKIEGGKEKPEPGCEFNEVRSVKKILYMTKGEAEALRAMALAMDVKLSEVVIIALREYVKTHRVELTEKFKLSMDNLVKLGLKSDVLD